MQNPKHILISRTDSIGDVVLTLPLAGIIKQEFPNAKISFLAKNYTLEAVKCCRFVDEAISWDELQKRSDKEQVDFLKAQKYDAIVHVFPSKAIAKLAQKAKIPLRIGTSHRLFHWWTCNKRVSFSRKKSDLHEAQLNTKLLAGLGIQKNFSKEDCAKHYGFSCNTEGNPFLGLLSPQKTNLILHPKSQGSALEWPLEQYQALIELLPEKDYQLFITGTEKEANAMAEFLQNNKGKAQNLCGQMTLQQLIGFISQADALVAASTGPLHLAAMSGRLALGLFSSRRPIHPGRWAPLGINAHSLVHDPNCPDCQKGLPCTCIQKISPEQVYQHLKEFSKKHP